VVGRYFICKKNGELYVFYTKKESKYGLDIWSKKRFITSFEIKNIPVHQDFAGSYYLIETDDYPKIIKCRIEIVKN